MAEQSAPAATPAAAGAPAPNGAGGESKWYQQVLKDPENQGLAELKRWGSPDDAFTSYRNLERLKGVPEHELLRIPRADADEATWEAFHAKLRPEKPDQYDLGELAPKEGQTDLRPLAHKYGLTQRQVKGLASELQQLTSAQLEQQAAQRAASADADVATLKSEWGPEYDANIAAAQRAAKHLGWDDATMDKLEQALGTKATLELAARLGRGLREDGMPGQTQTNGSAAAEPFGLTPQAAQVRLKQMQADPAFTARLYSPDQAVRLKAMDERAKVLALAYPE